ncbi:Phosphohistidine phosphatase SixA [Serratia symbiotica]|nr:Phosphohistidine phosphatase SixA [Serratia symbiotica]
MQVFIMRHGEAVLNAASDAVRPLTLGGRHESRLMATWLNTKSLRIERVLISPYLRVTQTLAMLQESMAVPEAEVLPDLTPNGNTKHISNHLQALAMQGVACLLIISHLPLIGGLVAELCPGERPPIFVTSSIANIKLTSTGHGKVKWQASPSQFICKYE